jgi:hypothetical protein
LHDRIITLLKYSQYHVLSAPSGEDHYCCFQPTLGGYDCKEDPSFACEAFKPCEILFKSDTAEHQVSISESSESPSGQTAQEMALIEESVYQYCSSGTAGIGLTKCQEICHGKFLKTDNHVQEVLENTLVFLQLVFYCPFRYRSSLLLREKLWSWSKL